MNMLTGMAVELQKELNEMPTATVIPVVTRGLSTTGKIGAIRISYDGVVLAELPDDEEGRRRLAYYRMGEPEGEIPAEPEKKENALTMLAQGIAAIAVSRGIDPSVPLKQLGKMLAGHPLAPFARIMAKLPVDITGEGFMGWEKKPEKEYPIGTKNVIVILGKDCPHSQALRKSWIKLEKMEKYLFPEGIAVMLFETDEHTKGVEKIFGAAGTPAFIFCDAYFKVKKVMAGEITWDRFLREVTYYD